VIHLPSKMRVFTKVLIANRGEIAIRIARTLREMGIAVVAVFTDADRGSRHLRFADEAVGLGSDPRAYLDVERILAAAHERGAQAIHPGYGFLSENPDLPSACERAGIAFIGPPSAIVRAMGNKQRARQMMQAAGVPVVPGGGAETIEEARATAASIGYPVLIKATEGGGGKGMRRVSNEAELAGALERTRSEAERAFGSGRIHLEKALSAPRHVEVQVLGDQHGNLMHLYERDCSIQRRHQKVLEETPCPALPDRVRDAMLAVAVNGARSIGYHSAGTFEFLLDADGAFYFLEMNTRLQVEHPITELVTGVDLVREMVRIAAGGSLSPSAPEPRGAAIEARIYAEDPEAGFLPSPGAIQLLEEPSGPGVRLDSGVEAGSVIPPDYDPLLAKLSVWGRDRAEALARMRRALSEYAVLGVATNLHFLDAVLADPEFGRGEYDTEFVDRRTDLRARRALSADERAELLAAAALVVEPPRAAPSAMLGLSPWVLAERATRR